MKTLIISTALIAAQSAPALAGHANPWATEDDVVLMLPHDENLAKSVDTPGEDEMKGTMVRTARGKLDPAVTSNGQRKGRK